MKESSHKRAYCAWFHLYEVSGIGKSIETESRLVVAQVWDGGNSSRMGVMGLTTDGYDVSFWGHEMFFVCGDGCTTLYILKSTELFTLNGWIYVVYELYLNTDVKNHDEILKTNKKQKHDIIKYAQQKAGKIEGKRTKHRNIQKQ